MALDQIETIQDSINPMDQVFIQKVEDYVKDHFVKRLSKKFTYHNFDHTIKVKNAANQIAEMANLPPADKEALVIAALFHDLGICISLDNHEEESKLMATSFLSSKAYPEDKIKKVTEIIEATKMEHEPLTHIEGIIKDADLCNLADENYFEEADKLRHEWEYINGKPYDDLEWHNINYEFMQQHEYHTDEAQILYGEKKEKNMQILKDKIGEEKAQLKKEKKKKSKSLGSTISSSKSAQTQFKTALRNHIDLSAIADNKANIMLSVNALIITVALPIIANQVIQNPLLLVPALVLLVVCVSSMIYATLATRPIKMRGQVSLDEISEKRSNLFFFGNFYKMKFEEYQKGMQLVVADEDLLDNSITRDLFYLGKALGTKYYNLRLCYNIFMFGMVAAVLAFAIAFALSPQGIQTAF